MMVLLKTKFLYKKEMHLGGVRVGNVREKEPTHHKVIKISNKKRLHEI